VDGYSVGYYICADAANPNITRAYVADHVDIMLSSAAWYEDPEMGPEEFWENVSRSSGVPLIIANTVGKQGKIDFDHSRSGVYLHGKDVYTVKNPGPVLGFVDWDTVTGEVRPVEELAV
jgi:predicted amidohydrolase